MALINIKKNETKRTKKLYGLDVLKFVRANFTSAGIFRLVIAYFVFIYFETQGFHQMRSNRRFLPVRTHV